MVYNSVLLNAKWYINLPTFDRNFCFSSMYAFQLYKCISYCVVYYSTKSFLDIIILCLNLPPEGAVTGDDVISHI